MTAHPLSEVVKTWKTRMAGAIGRLLIEKPDGFTRQEVINAIYGENANPEGKKYVTVGIKVVNRRLAPLGWHIPKAKGDRTKPGLYRLERLP